MALVKITTNTPAYHLEYKQDETNKRIVHALQVLFEIPEEVNKILHVFYGIMGLMTIQNHTLRKIAVEKLNLNSNSSHWWNFYWAIYEGTLIRFKRNNY